jgi:uncharacterized integral membrane protein
MPEREYRYDVTFRDFQFLQGHMTRRVFEKNRARHVRALFWIVLCAVLLTLAIVANVDPVRTSTLLSDVLPYPVSFYAVMIACLTGAILTLIPAIRLRLRTMRLQVSDDGPLLGATRLMVEPDALIVDRGRMTARYAWSAFQGVEIARNAVILPIDNGIGVIVPAAAFHSDAERLDFAATVAKRVDAAKTGATDTPTAMDAGNDRAPLA